MIFAECRAHIVIKKKKRMEILTTILSASLILVFSFSIHSVIQEERIREATTEKELDRF